MRIRCNYYLFILIPTLSSSFCCSRVFVMHVYSASSGYSCQEKKGRKYKFITRLTVWLLPSNWTSKCFLIWKWLFQSHFCGIWDWKILEWQDAHKLKRLTYRYNSNKAMAPPKLEPIVWTDAKLNVTETRCTVEWPHFHECPMKEMWFYLPVWTNIEVLIY